MSILTSCVDIIPKMQCNDNDERFKVEYLETPITSEKDEAAYRVIRLPNGLTALLIGEEEGDHKDEDKHDTSDEYNEENSSSIKRIMKNAYKAKCGLCVGVGSFSDPLEIPGLAHLLEHMVYMGSEKYPQENDFHEFIIKHGGHTNATTDNENTIFFFHIEEKYLLSALDRFAQFFIKPLMKKDAIIREREAIESEFQLALSCDENRKEQLFSSFARTNHPASKFTWGNLITLRDNVHNDKLYEELHKFRKRHYSAHRMKLVIQTKLPLDTLEKYVTMSFADIPNNGLPPDDFTAFKNVSFDTPAFRKIYKVKPFEDICQLEITWAVPSLLDFCKSKPNHYVAWIIMHEGKGSLFSYLRKKMWILDSFGGTCANDFEYNSMYALFKISVDLSYEGQHHLEEILNAIFSFINLLKKEGPQKRIYDEIYKIRKDTFRFSDMEDNVDDLCINMHYYSPRDYITGYYNLLLEYNPEAIQKYLDYLVPETANIMIFNNDFDCFELNKIEPWFKIQYTDIEIPKEWIKHWKSIEPLPDFHLPLPNTFITSDFSLISMPAEVPQYPVKLHKDDMSEIWYRPVYYIPKCYINLHFVSNLGLQSPKNAALMEMYCSVLRLLSTEELYPAIEAEFHYDIRVDEKGIIIKMNGFNEKLPLLLMIIAKYMVDYPNLITKDLFEIVKVQQLRILYNKFIKPQKLVKDVKLWILKFVHYTHFDMHAALCDSNFEEFRDFVKSFTDHLYIQCLVQGNMTQDAVIKTILQYIEVINCGFLSFSMISKTKVIQIPLGTYYCKLKNINKIDVNSVVTNYYQADVTSIKLSVLIDLLIIIMREPLSNRLRTQEQLGYDVSCDLIDVNGILGYYITVCTQADKYTTEQVDQRIEEFLKSFNKILETFTQEELDDVKEVLRKFKKSGIREGRNWSIWKEITNWQYMFDRHEREALAIKNIKINDLREWFAKHTLNGSNCRKLSIHVVGTNEGNLKESVVKNENSQIETLQTAVTSYGQVLGLIRSFMV